MAACIPSQSGSGQSLSLSSSAGAGACADGGAGSCTLSSGARDTVVDGKGRSGISLSDDERARSSLEWNHSDDQRRS